MDDIIPFQPGGQPSASQPSGSSPPNISSLASVDRRARIGQGVEIGPFCVVGPDVEIGDHTVLQSNVSLCGRVKLGQHNRLFPGVVIGGEPQDVNYDGTPTDVVIGDRNVIRECVTINRASTKEERVTTVGDDCFFMACVHVAHDCRVGNNVKIANATLLGGHVHVDDHATISGNAGVHHFTRIGAFSFVTGVGRVIQDVPPYLLAEGNPSRPRCVNVVALKRKRFSNEAIRNISEAYKLLFRSRVGLDTTREILKSKDRHCSRVETLLDFIAYQQAGRHGRGREQTRRAA